MSHDVSCDVFLRHVTQCDVIPFRFVNSDTILEYVSSDQLLVNLGGTDQWQFDYETEKTVMLNLLQGLQGRGEGEGEDGGSPSHSSDVSHWVCLPDSSMFGVCCVTLDPVQ